MNYNLTGQYPFNGEVYEFHYTNKLSAIEKLAFVLGVCDWIITSEGYYPMLRSYAFRYQLCLMTDIDRSVFADEGGSFNIAKFIEFADESRFEYDMIDNIDSALIEELNDTIDLNVEYKTGIHRDNISAELSELIKSIRKSIDAIASPDVINNIAKLSENGELSAQSIVGAYLSKNKPAAKQLKAESAAAIKSNKK